jgi:hypothetical protein
MTSATLDIFNKLADEENQLAAKRENDYRRLVADLAAGKQPSVSKIQQLLTDAKKTRDDLKADVSRITRRAELKALAAKKTETESEIAAINTKRAELVRIFNEAESNYLAGIDPLNEAYDEANRQLAESDKAADELVRSCDNPGLIRERNDIDEELDSITSRLPNLRNQAESQERESNRYKELSVKQIALPAEKRTNESLAERYRRDAEKSREEVRKLQRQYDSLQKRRDALRLKMQQA